MIDVHLSTVQIDLSFTSSYLKKFHTGESFGLPLPVFFVGAPTVGIRTGVLLVVDVDGEGKG